MRTGTGVIQVVPTGAGKTLPMILASLESDKSAIIILPLLNLEQQMERDLTRIGISYTNLTTAKVENLEQELKEKKPAIILTNVEALGDKSKREALRKSRLQVGHISWDEAKVRL